MFGSDQNYLKNFNNELLLITQIESKIGYIPYVEKYTKLYNRCSIYWPSRFSCGSGHLGNPHPDVKKVMNDIVKKHYQIKKFLAF